MGLTDNEIGKAYRVGDRIGQGSSGEVYQAVQQSLERPVAVKIMRSDISVCEYGWAVERFQHEAHVMASLQHPNIVTLYDCGYTLDGRFFMALEFVDGATLDCLWKDERLSLPTIKTIFCGLLDGLEATHRSGLVHRDLKPTNVMVTLDLEGNQCAKLLDFGCSIFSNCTGWGSQEVVTGSLGYMSPEQANAEKVDATSDLYAVGVMLCQALMGVHPYKASTVQGWVAVHNGSKEPEMRGIPDDFVQVVRTAMSKDPGDRFPSAAVMRRALEHCTNGKQRRRPRPLSNFQRRFTTALVSYSTVLLWAMLWTQGKV